MSIVLARSLEAGLEMHDYLFQVYEIMVSLLISNYE